MCNRKYDTQMGCYIHKNYVRLTGNTSSKSMHNTSVDFVV